jgi:transposase-like protein
VSCHRARNVLAKVPKNAQADVKADYWAIFDVPEAVEPGPDAVAFVQARIDAFVRRWRDSYPAACAGLRQLQDLRRQLLEPQPSLHRNSPPQPCTGGVSGTGGRTPAHR